MEDAKANEFVLMIRALWNEQKNRELLYLEALKKDSMGSFRRVLSQGHVSALLFQKEIRWVYDYFKCFLNDRELGDSSGNVSKNVLSRIETAHEKEEIAKCLKTTESATLQLYKSLRTYLEKDSEARNILDEHLARISEFYEALSKMECGSFKTIAYTAAA
jgi:c-di-AMP phosphodiesterase-like protein